MTLDTPDQSKQMQLIAQVLQLREKLHEMQRPLVIEFSGTPKAGKSTTIAALSKFLRRHAVAVEAFRERASVCPVKDKHHPFFNIWTGSVSLAQMLAALERPHRVFILDRGLFDSLVWINMHAAHGSVSSAELSAIESFFLLKRFTQYIDLVVVMSSSPAQSLEREFKDQLNPSYGSIMNPGTLHDYNLSLGNCLEKYRTNFSRVIHIDTSGARVVDKVVTVVSEVMSVLNKVAEHDTQARSEKDA